jgi:hypothetical protein
MGYGNVLGGIYGRVENVPDDVTGTNHPEATAWVMLLSSDGASWAQIGWSQTLSGYGRQTFSQVNESGFFGTYFNSAPTNQYPYFTVLYNKHTWPIYIPRRQ